MIVAPRWLAAFARKEAPPSLPASAETELADFVEVVTLCALAGASCITALHFQKARTPVAEVRHILLATSTFARERDNG